MHTHKDNLNTLCALYALVKGMGTQLGMRIHVCHMMH